MELDGIGAKLIREQCELKDLRKGKCMKALKKAQEGDLVKKKENLKNLMGFENLKESKELLKEIESRIIYIWILKLIPKMYILKMNKMFGCQM